MERLRKPGNTGGSGRDCGADRVRVGSRARRILPVLEETLLMIRTMLFTLGVLAMSACGGQSGYGGSCSQASDCKSSMICPTSGPMSGRCTQACTKDEECAAVGGGVCSSDVCNPK